MAMNSFRRNPSLSFPSLVVAVSFVTLAQLASPQSANAAPAWFKNLQRKTSNTAATVKEGMANTGRKIGVAGSNIGNQISSGASSAGKGVQNALQSTGSTLQKVPQKTADATKEAAAKTADRAKKVVQPKQPGMGAGRQAYEDYAKKKAVAEQGAKKAREDFLKLQQKEAQARQALQKKDQNFNNTRSKLNEAKSHHEKLNHQVTHLEKKLDKKGKLSDKETEALKAQTKARDEAAAKVSKWEKAHQGATRARSGAERKVGATEKRVDQVRKDLGQGFFQKKIPLGIGEGKLSQDYVNKQANKSASAKTKLQELEKAEGNYVQTLRRRDSVKSQKDAAIAEKAQLSSEIPGLKTQLAASQKKLTQLAPQQKQLKTEIQKLEPAESKFKTEDAKLNAGIKSAQTVIKNFQQQKSKLLNDGVDASDRRIQTLDNRIAEQTKKIDGIKKERETLANNSQKDLDTLQEKRSALSKVDGDIKTAETEAKTARESLTTKQLAASMKDGDIKKLEQDLKKEESLLKTAEFDARKKGSKTTQLTEDEKKRYPDAPIPEPAPVAPAATVQKATAQTPPATTPANSSTSLLRRSNSAPSSGSGTASNPATPIGSGASTQSNGAAPPSTPAGSTAQTRAGTPPLTRSNTGLTTPTGSERYGSGTNTQITRTPSGIINGNATPTGALSGASTPGALSRSPSVDQRPARELDKKDEDEIKSVFKKGMEQQNAVTSPSSKSPISAERAAQIEQFKADSARIAEKMKVRGIPDQGPLPAVINKPGITKSDTTEAPAPALEYNSKGFPKNFQGIPSDDTSRTVTRQNSMSAASADPSQPGTPPAQTPLQNQGSGDSSVQKAPALLPGGLTPLPPRNPKPEGNRPAPHVVNPNQASGTVTSPAGATLPAFPPAPPVAPPASGSRPVISLPADPALPPPDQTPLNVSLPTKPVGSEPATSSVVHVPKGIPLSLLRGDSSGSNSSGQVVPLPPINGALPKENSPDPEAPGTPPSTESLPSAGSGNNGP